VHFSLRKKDGRAARRPRIPNTGPIDITHDLLTVAKFAHPLQFRGFDSELIHLQDVFLDLVH